MLADLGANVRNDARIAELMGGGKCAKSRLMFYLSKSNKHQRYCSCIYMAPGRGAREQGVQGDLLQP